MWKQWIIAILGLIFIVTPFLGFTTFIFKAIMALGGVVFAVFGFWLLSEEKLFARSELAPHSGSLTFQDQMNGGKENESDRPHDL